MQFRQVQQRQDSLVHSMMLHQEKMQKSPIKKPFSPLRSLYHTNFLKKQLPVNKSKNYKSFQKLSQGKNSHRIPNEIMEASARPHPENNQLQFESNPKNQVKFLKIKQRYAGDSIASIPDHFYRPLKTPIFLKTLSASTNESMIKQFQQVLQPKPKYPFSKTQKSPPKPFLKPSKPRQYKTLLINNKKEVFQMIKFMDEGSYGKVHLVQHVLTHAIFCLKIIQKSQLNELSFNQLVRQSLIQSYLNHPNIINLYSFSADAEFVYLLLQASPGQNLYKRLNKTPFKEKEVKKIIKDVCVAVQYMHKNDIIHRDIKPQNILIFENMVKICDFGWAVHSPLMRNTQCGTPLYTPPQMAKCEYYDSKIDIWCIGILTYELLYGTIPFEIRHPNDLSRIINQQVYFSKEVPVTDSAKHFINKCLQKNAYERYSIRQALEDDFLVGKIGDSYRHTYC